MGVRRHLHPAERGHGVLRRSDARGGMWRLHSGQALPGLVQGAGPACRARFHPVCAVRQPRSLRRPGPFERARSPPDPHRPTGPPASDLGQDRCRRHRARSPPRLPKSQRQTVMECHIHEGSCLPSTPCISFNKVFRELSKTKGEREMRAGQSMKLCPSTRSLSPNV